MNPTLKFKISNLRWFINTIKEFGGEFIPVHLETTSKVKHPKHVRYVGAAHYHTNDRGVITRKHLKDTKWNRKAN